jgi:hypothetical protein
MKSQFCLLLIAVINLCFIGGCCGDCDEQDNRILSIRVLDKNTNENLTDSLDSKRFLISQNGSIGIPLLPKLTFKDTEIQAEFPMICGSERSSATYQVVIDNQVVEGFDLAVKRTTKSCCGCTDATGTISELKGTTNSEVQLGKNANLLIIKI